MYPSQRFYEVSNRVTQYIVLGYQIIALIVFVFGLYFAYGWLKNPFIGGFFEHTLVLNGSDTKEFGKHWALYEEGFKQGDQLISVNGTPIKNSSELKSVLGSSAVNQPVSVQIRTREGDLKTASVILQSFSSADRIAYFILPMVLSLLFLIISLWIFGLRRTEPAGRAFSMLTSSLAIATGALFDLYTSHHFTYIWTISVGLIGGSLIDLGLVFPQETRFVIGRPYLRWIGLAIGIILGLRAFGTLFDLAHHLAYIITWIVIYVFTGLSGLFYIRTLISTV